MDWNSFLIGMAVGMLCAWFVCDLVINYLKELTMTTTDIFIIGMYLTSIVGTVVIMSSIFWFIDSLIKMYNSRSLNVKKMIAEDGTEWLVGYIDEFPGYKKLF